MPWHRTRLAAILLRLLGAALLGLAFLTGRALFRAPIAIPAATDWLRAAFLFVAACAGSALLLLGQHLFDPVPLPPRWTRHF